MDFMAYSLEPALASAYSHYKIVPLADAIDRNLNRQVVFNVRNLGSPIIRRERFFNESLSYKTLSLF